MNIFNTTTQEVVELGLNDPKTNTDMLGDYTPINSDSNIKYNVTTEQYEADTATIDWWQNILDQYQKMEDRVYEIKQYGSDSDRAKLDEILEDYEHTEFNDRAEYINQALDEAGIE